jgi:hypothetical protein
MCADSRSFQYPQTQTKNLVEELRSSAHMETHFTIRVAIIKLLSNSRALMFLTYSRPLKVFKAVNQWSAFFLELVSGFCSNDSTSG